MRYRVTSETAIGRFSIALQFTKSKNAGEVRRLGRACINREHYTVLHAKRKVEKTKDSKSDSGNIDVDICCCALDNG